MDNIDEKDTNTSLIFFAFDADSAGRKIGQAILSDDPAQLYETSKKIEHGEEFVDSWAKKHGGICYSLGGDQGLYSFEQDIRSEIETMRADYEFATQFTITVGVGNSLSESGKALIVGKLRGKNQTCYYDTKVEQEYLAAQQATNDGTATGEGKKLGDAYMKTQTTPMKESEDSHADCQYCAEMQEANVHDEDHCQYCHDMPGEDETQPHCEYCAMADQANAYDHDHNEENCEYCAAANQTQDHEHSGDDCEYCAAAAVGDDSSADVMSQMDNQNNPTDMALAEDEVPEAGPDLSEVLQTGLDQHSDNIQKERVIQMVSEALEGFKACKGILERAQQQAPQLYDSSLAMLKAMIEMAKMLGLAPQEEQQPDNGNPQQSQPQQEQSSQEQPEEQASGKMIGR